MTARRREDPQCFNMLTLERRPLDGPGVLDGLPAADLTRDEHTGSFSRLVELPAGWRADGDGAAGDLELFVLEGDLGFEDQDAGCGAYLHLPQHAPGGELRSRRGALALALVNPDLPNYPPAYVQPRLVRSWAEPWVPTLPGSHGVMHKSLRRPDPQTDEFDGGPGGFLRMFFIAPGTADPAQHVHHECWEEVVTLTGDVLMADQGLTPTGTVLSNPQEHWHGPFASHGGAVLLVQSNGPMGAPWPHRDYPAGPALVEHYFETSSWIEPQRHTDWADATDLHPLLDTDEHRRWAQATPRWGDAQERDAQWRWRAGRSA